MLPPAAAKTFDELTLTAVREGARDGPPSTHLAEAARPLAVNLMTVGSSLHRRSTQPAASAASSSSSPDEVTSLRHTCCASNLGSTTAIVKTSSSFPRSSMTRFSVSSGVQPRKKSATRNGRPARPPGSPGVNACATPWRGGRRDAAACALPTS